MDRNPGRRNFGRHGIHDATAGGPLLRFKLSAQAQSSGGILCNPLSRTPNLDSYLKASYAPLALFSSIHFDSMSACEILEQQQRI